MDFVAIDFETANRNWASACEIGMVVVEDGRVVDTYRRLIRPTPNQFDYGNIRIHKITPEQVMHEPTFAELYDEMLPYFENKHMVAHNASFDMGVLLGSIKQYGLPLPSLTYSCTVQLARRVWPEAPRYGLGIISAYLGIELEHHQALSDANACAQIMIQAQQIFGTPHVDELLREVGLQPRSIDDYGSSTKKKKSSRSNRTATRKAAIAKETKQRTQIHNWPSHPKIKDIVFDASDAHEGHPVYGKRFVFTGELTTCSREEAQRKVLELGGKCTTAVSKSTDYVVQGVPTWRRVTSKVKKAKELGAEGLPVKLIDEEAFLELCG
jgi:DNA polymerase-3 subunit epsilon